MLKSSTNTYFPSKNAEEDHNLGMLEHFDHCNWFNVAWILWHRLKRSNLIIKLIDCSLKRKIQTKKHETKGLPSKNNANYRK